MTPEEIAQTGNACCGLIICAVIALVLLGIAALVIAAALS